MEPKDKTVAADKEMEANPDETTFCKLGVINELCKECDTLGWNSPTVIQKKAIPAALKGLDVIGLAETGSGKTGAFCLPALQALMHRPQRLFCLILAPIRELAYQIKEQVEALGKSIGVNCAAIVGGMDIRDQADLLKKKPHFIVATPGRLLDHLQNTRGFNLRALKFLVIDEADKVLNMDFVEDIDKILDILPKDRQTLLFSATMTKKIKKLDRAYLLNPVRVEASEKYKTVETLDEYMFISPKKFRFIYLLYLIINDEKIEKAAKIIIFCRTQELTIKISIMLRRFNFNALPIYGKLEQKRRLASLTKFKTSDKCILVATDVAARGLDIPNVDYVINFSVPMTSKEYIHRVGRTARAGERGIAITIVSQYDFFLFKKAEMAMDKVLEVYPIDKKMALDNLQTVVYEMDDLVTEEIKTLDVKTLKPKKKRKFDAMKDKKSKNSKNKKFKSK